MPIFALYVQLWSPTDIESTCMNGGIGCLADHLGFGYWFVPTIIVCAAILLAAATFAPRDSTPSLAGTV
ncbi:hypothetical protein DMC47_12790 [Nostoc sp. 3335mG]|nr:hypothetical protein DMC47_12790 [Nostoc sp. 3335mG]